MARLEKLERMLGERPNHYSPSTGPTRRECLQKYWDRIRTKRISGLNSFRLVVSCFLF